jgi:hypothetical protein
MIRKPWTIRRMMVAVAVVGTVLGSIASEQWRWGYPRRVPFDHGNALSWMATVIQSDFRKYDGFDVQLLMDHVARSGLLVGKKKDEVIQLLGSPEIYAIPPAVGSEGRFLTYLVGMVPRSFHAGPPLLICEFEAADRCVKVTTQGSY